jgi:DNA-binding NarL/FixJ family response regulator
MVSEGRTVPVAVLGAPDLLLTSVVDALRSRGYDVMHIARPRTGSDFSWDDPGVLIVDVDPPGAVHAVAHAASAGWTVIAVGSEDERDRAAAAVVAGAQEWIGKDSPFGAIVEAVSAAVAGSLRMSDERREEWRELHRGVEQARAARVERLMSLSRREVEVLSHLAAGRRAAEIATALFVSLATVRTHIRSILTKLEVNSQEQAVALYREGARPTPGGPGH